MTTFFRIDDKNHKKIYFNSDFIEELEQSHLALIAPFTIIVLNNNFNSPIDELSDNIVYLKIGKNFNLPIRKLPESLTHLKFVPKCYFSHSLPNILPKGLKTLEMRGKYNSPLPELPKSLVNLYINCDFNQIIPELPPNLIRLILGNSFDKNIKKFPKTLTHLSVGNKYNHIIILPPNLTNLALGKKYTWWIENLHPDIKIIVHKTYTFVDKLSNILFTENIEFHG
jgi:hypothetical protein